MTQLRVGVVCDLREEGWHSMDLIADMLLSTIPAVAGKGVDAIRLCPPMVHRWTRLPVFGRTARARLGDRLTGRLWDYPRWLAPLSLDFDVFHIVDHSYAHLVRVLPADRTIITCNDTDAIQAALPGVAGRFDPARVLASRILDSLSRAAHVACITQATRSELLATGRVRPERVSVVYLGVHPSCSPLPDAAADAEIDRMLGPRQPEILHVGSTIPRKRIDVLIEIFAELRRAGERVRLVRAGGPLTPAQRALAVKLGVIDAIVEVPFLERPLLAALYRRASVLVLPSEREGFGLPVVEAMACGTPVVASAIPALREVGGDGAVYCAPGDVRHWAEAVKERLRQQRSDSAARENRRKACLAAAARFDWRIYAVEMAKLYCLHADLRRQAS